MALSLSLLLDVLFIRFQSSDIDTSIAAFLVLTGLPSGRRWSVRVSNNKRIEIVKKQKGGCDCSFLIRDARLVNIFIFSNSFFQIYWCRWFTHHRVEARGVQRGRFEKEKFRKRKKGKLVVLEYSKCVLKYISIRWLRKYIFWPHPSCYQSRSSRLQHSRRFQSVFWLFVAVVVVEGIFFSPLIFPYILFYLNYDATTGDTRRDCA
jgi:hypothetical protein